jgi:hypothetical protein
MTTVWILWWSDDSGKHISGIYDHKVRAEEDLRQVKEEDPKTHYYIQEKGITK